PVEHAASFEFRAVTEVDLRQYTEDDGDDDEEQRDGCVAREGVHGHGTMDSGPTMVNRRAKGAGTLPDGVVPGKSPRPRGDRGAAGSSPGHGSSRARHRKTVSPPGHGGRGVRRA